MKKMLIIIIVLTVSLLSAINLEQAKELGLENNLTYQNIVNSKKSATASKLQAYSAILPSVVASGSYSGEDLDLEDTNYSLRLTQPLIQGGTILYGMKIANSQEDVAENNISNAKVELLAEVENKYYSVLEAKALLDVAQKDLDRAELQYNSAEIKYRLGAISTSEFMQFQLDRSQNDVALFTSEKTYKTALKEFNNYLGTSAKEPEIIEMESPFAEAKEISNLNIKSIEKINENLNNLIMKQNYSVLNSEENLTLSKSYLRQSQTSFLPSVDFSISKNWDNNSLTEGLEDSETFSLNFSLPIFPLVDKGLSTQTKKYDYLNSENNLQETKDSVQLQTESIWLDLVASSKNLIASEISLNYAGALYDQATVEFQLGDLSSSDYLESSISLSNAETQYYSAIYSYLRIKSNLNKLLCVKDYSTLNEIIFQGVK